jgi:MoCo/4Fe-4S cofactor protein with predicted Tat translocation signal
MKQYWRSENELEKTEEYKKFLHREFQEDASVLDNDVSRRSFLKVMGASAALAGVTGCNVRKPSQKVRPYAKMPEYLTPGKAVFYATGMSVGEDVVGLLVKAQQGRPTKVEGNKGHSLSGGKTTAYNQASVLDLYDPDRLKTVFKDGKSVDSDAFKKALVSIVDEHKSDNGKRLAILTETQNSPAFYFGLNALRKALPEMSTFRYEPVNRDNLYKGLRDVIGHSVTPHYKFKKANIIISFGADFLSDQVSSVSNSFDFSSRRDPDKNLNRLYVFENNFTITGAKADHRYPVSHSKIVEVLFSLARELQKRGALELNGRLKALVNSARNESVQTVVIKAMASDLIDNKGKSLLIAGNEQASYVHSLVFMINDQLKNNNKTVNYTKLNFSSDPMLADSNLESISNLSQGIKSGRLDTLFILGGDPVYTSPSDLDFASVIKLLKTSLHLTQKENSTSFACNWVVPRSHYLESWGDMLDVEGTAIIQQPVIRPMYSSITDIEFLNRLIKGSKSDYSLVRSYWRRGKGFDFEDTWNSWLHNGVNTDTKKLIITDYSVSFSFAFMASINAYFTSKKRSGLELFFVKDNSLYDGRFANNGWLQELPDPITKLTWDNAVLISPATAKELKLKSEDKVSVTAGKRNLVAAIMVSPGHADRSLTLNLGYGNKVVGRVGENAGFNAYTLRSTESFDTVDGVSLVKLNEIYELASTQDHGSMEDRPIFRSTSLNDYKKNPDFATERGEALPEGPLRSSYPDIQYTEGNQWGMAIDLGKCTGCNVCVTSCQAENNIPIVGKKEVLNGREMHWIRIDRYYEGSSENPNVVSQPMTCLQCENAPCEQVCPVAATTHDEEGLNSMTYNRCVGTRYCADNCPAKVRRFNFFDYHQRHPQSKSKDRLHLFDYFREPEKAVQMQFNPDVTVRMRGVMEKCTYCVQRISEGKITAKNENRNLNDGDVVTACQQACPSEAIVFGNILDKKSKVYKLKNSKRNYSVLEQLLLKARTTYIAEVLNPNPLIEAWTNKSKKKMKVHS